MRGKSHHFLGKYLVQHYLQDIPEHYINAFLTGCTQPDKNPFTYLKGSFRHRWLRGHNYRNARKYMRKLSHRLEQKAKWNMLDYYMLGKLIHYTADAFTLAHNDFFSSGLKDHRTYEAELQELFLTYLLSDPQVDIRLAGSIIEIIGAWHDEYAAEEMNIHTDAYYALCVCSCIFVLLFTCRIV